MNPPALQRILERREEHLKHYLLIYTDDDYRENYYKSYIPKYQSAEEIVEELQ